jgi:hypothetical protein
MTQKEPARLCPLFCPKNAALAALFSSLFLCVYGCGKTAEDSGIPKLTRIIAASSVTDLAALRGKTDFSVYETIYIGVVGEDSDFDVSKLVIAEHALHKEAASPCSQSGNPFLIYASLKRTEGGIIQPERVVSARMSSIQREIKATN